MIKAAEEGDVNALKDILEANLSYVNAKFCYKYEVLGGLTKVS